MLLSTAIPIVIAAMVIVIISSGIRSKPIIPNIKKAAIKFGTTPINDNFKFLKHAIEWNVFLGVMTAVPRLDLR